MRRLNIIVVLALIAPAALAQQPSGTPGTLSTPGTPGTLGTPGTPDTPGTRTVRGVVVTANDTPLPRVRVAPTIAPPPELARMWPLESAPGVFTDDRGQFTIQVPAATSSIRLAFTKARYTTHIADISPRELTNGRFEIRARMSLATAISGRVIDRSGTGVMLAVVTLLRVGTAAAEAPIETMTNDLGEFRFGGLAVGTYAIASRPPPSAPGVRVVFSDRQPDAATAQGPTVKASFGIETGNINLTIDMPSELNQDAAKRTDPDPEANGSLSGRVVDLDGTPIARAVVLVYRPSIPAREVETDARGRYRIDRLGPGDYVVEARKRGFETRRYGQDRTVAARSSAIEKRVMVTNGQAVDSIDVMIARAGVIAGTIVDEFGEPMQDVAVSALQLSSTAGHFRWVRTAVQGSSRTDDRGQYRLFGLLPATYVVQAAVRDTLSPTSGYVPLFYPGTPSIAQATTTKVDFGVTVSSVDLMLRPMTAHTLTGIVLDSSGRPPVRAELTLATRSERSGAIQTEPVRVTAEADGSFAFTNVGPGVYVVQATGDIASKELDARTSEEQFAASFVTVTVNDPPPLEIRLAQGAKLTGRVRYEGATDGPPPIFNLAPLPIDRDLSPPLGDGWNSASLLPDDTFEFQGVFGPTVLRELFQENDRYLKSVVIKGQEQVDSPFDFGTSGTFSDIEVLVSAFGAAVRGRVTDDRAAPVRDYTVVVFSTLPDRWSVFSRWVKKADRPSADGFTVRGLPPGDYWVAAIERRNSTFEPTADPDLLESLSSHAVRITLGEGQSQDLTLRLVRR